MQSGFWRKLRSDYRFVRNGTSGRRFRDFRLHKLEQPDSLIQRILMILVALLLIIIGLAIGWLPGPGGFLSIIGLAILAPYIPAVPYCLDKCEVFARGCWRVVSDRFSSLRS